MSENNTLGLFVHQTTDEPIDTVVVEQTDQTVSTAPSADATAPPLTTTTQPITTESTLELSTAHDVNPENSPVTTAVVLHAEPRPETDTVQEEDNSAEEETIVTNTADTDVLSDAPAHAPQPSGTEICPDETSTNPTATLDNAVSEEENAVAAPADVSLQNADASSGNSTPTDSPEPVRETTPADNPTGVTQHENQAPTETQVKDDSAQESQKNGFRKLNLLQPVVDAVERAGYFQPTDIQAQIIPHMLQRRDVLAQSQTGTGKTAGFALPILSQLDTDHHWPQVLVLAPTRELAMQVADSFQKYAQCLPRVKVAAIYGGADYSSQFRQLKGGAQIVVGTPGRVIDHIKRGSLKLEQLQCLVLDEADEMLNMGFLDDVKFVLEQTPDTIQVALFSATLPKPIRAIAQRYLDDPARITIQAKTMTAESIRQRAIFVSPRQKISVLTRVLEAEETDGVIVFTKTRESTVVVADKLNNAGLRAVALNGDMPQKTRERTIEQLKAGRLDILVATDVAARGLDVSRISHVFNYDLPQGTESYIHRIGRTGRAGRAGEAVIFLTSRERYRLRTIERVTRQPIEIVEPPNADTINATRVKRFQQRLQENATAPEAQFFRKMLTEFAAESSMSLEDISAALAVMNQNGRPFFMSAERPRRDYEDSRREDSDRSGRKEFGQNKHAGRGERKGRETGPPKPGMTRYRIAIGWRDGVKPGNIVGAIANEAGINGSDIGPITIHNAFTTIDLPESMSEDAYQTLQQTRVVGRQLRIRPASESDSTATKFRKERSGKPGRAPHKKKGKRIFGKKKAGGKPHKRKAK